MKQRVEEDEAEDQEEARTHRTFQTRLTRTLNLIPKGLGAMAGIQVSPFK